MKLILITLLFVTSLSAFSKDNDTVPIKKKNSEQYVDPTVPMEDKSLLGKQKTPATKKQMEAEKEEKHPAPNELTPYVASLGTFGSSRLNEQNLKETLGKELDQWLKMGLKGEERAVDLEHKLAKKVKDKFGFYSADWSVIQFFNPGDLAIHITLDVVEKEDVASRMPFHPAPTGQFKDPENLLRAWSEYENVSLDLIEQGQLEPDNEKCTGVAFHCPFGHKHPSLKKYGPLFVDGVNRNYDKLVEIQTKDSRADYRAAATYLLAYYKDGKKVVERMVDRIKDNEDLVRNNALRVLGDIAEFYPQFVIPTTPVVQALGFPRASDRSKAVFVAHLLALNSQAARDEILKGSVPNLLKLLASKMPDQKEFSHAILRKISGKEYPQADIVAWNNWYTKLPKDRGVSQTK